MSFFFNNIKNKKKGFNFMRSDLQTRYEKDVAFFQRAVDFGLTPKDIMILLAIGYSKCPSYPNPTNPNNEHESLDALRVRTGISNRKLAISFWRGIEYTTKDNFINAINDKLARMAARVSTLKTSTLDPASGFRVTRLGSRLDALKNAIKSGNVASIIAMTKELASDPKFAGQVQRYVVQYIPKQQALAFAMEYGDDVLAMVAGQYDIDLNRLKNDPMSYLQELGMSLGSKQVDGLKKKAMSIISQKGKDIISEQTDKYLGDKGSDIVSSILSGTTLGAVPNELSYALTPQEISIAKRVYDNAFPIASELWSYRNNQSQFFSKLKEKIYLIGPSFIGGQNAYTLDLSGQVSGRNPFYIDVNAYRDPSQIEIANISTLRPLILAYAFGNAFGKDKPFDLPTKVLHFMDFEAIFRKNEAKLKQTIKNIDSASEIPESSLDETDQPQAGSLDTAKSKELADLEAELARVKSAKSNVLDSGPKKPPKKPLDNTIKNPPNKYGWVVGLGLIGGLGSLYYYKFRKK